MAERGAKPLAEGGAVDEGRHGALRKRNLEGVEGHCRHGVVADEARQFDDSSVA
jgi:hypothetical protein